MDPDNIQGKVEAHRWRYRMSKDMLSTMAWLSHRAVEISLDEVTS